MHCRRLLDAGCDGIALLGTTGEATSFSIEQRLTVMRAVAAAGLPLERFLVGTGAAALADAVRLTRAAVELGFAGALVVPPFYFKPVGDAGVVAYYRALVERVADARLRLYLYHFPQLTGIEIGASAVAELRAAYPTIVAGLKDSSGAPAYARSMAERFPGLAVFPSTEAVLLDAREGRFAGCISATVNVNAPLAAVAWRGEPRHRAAAQREATAVREIIARYPLVAALRATMAAVSGDAAWERIVPPLVALDGEPRAALLAALRERESYPALATALA